MDEDQTTQAPAPEADDEGAEMIETSESPAN